MTFDDFKRTVSDYLLAIPIINEKMHWLEEKTGISRPTIIKILYVILAGNLILGFGSRLLSNVIGFIYPAYQLVGVDVENIQKFGFFEKKNEIFCLIFYLTPPLFKRQSPRRQLY